MRYVPVKRTHMQDTQSRSGALRIRVSSSMFIKLNLGESRISKWYIMACMLMNWQLWIVHCMHRWIVIRIWDRNVTIKDTEVEISENLSYVEEPIRIVDRKIKQLWNREIPMVKVIWKNHGLEEATWETAERMRRDYPQLFNAPGNLNFEDKIFIRMGELSHPCPKPSLLFIHACNVLFIMVISWACMP